VRTTTGPGDAEEFAAAGAAAAEFDVIAAAGGDGTLNEVANGLCRGAEGNPDAAPALATVPLGTVNVLALEIGLTQRADAIARMIAAGPYVPMTAGLANGRRFVLTAGVGIDAAAVQRLSAAAKRAVGQAAYTVAAARALAAEGGTVFEVEVDGERLVTSSLTITHASRYGAPHVAAPQARLIDPHLTALIALGRGRRDHLRYAWAYVRGRLPEVPDIRTVTARRIRVLEPAGKPVQLDGDIWGQTPLEVGMDGPAMRLIVPEGCALLSA
jgi:diacylglycerol kinase family enzyme